MDETIKELLALLEKQGQMLDKALALADLAQQEWAKAQEASKCQSRS